MEGSGQTKVLSHTIDRPRPTDRQLLGVEIPLASYDVLRTERGCCHPGIPAPDPIPALTPESRRPTLTVIPTEPAGRLEGSPTRNRCRLGRKGLALLSKSDTMTKESLNRAAGGRCIAAGRWYAKAPSPVPSPPLGSRGRGPWSGRGSQRVKPRLVSSFERRRLFLKGQEFLRVVCPKARLYLPKWQRFRVGDPSARSTRSG